MLDSSPHSQLLTLDRRFAWFTAVIPGVATLLAIALWCGGVAPSKLDGLLFVGMYLLSVIGLEVGYHRLFAHRSFEAHPRVRVVLAILGSMCFQGPVIWWAATHRRHHALADAPGDPHSPRCDDPALSAKLRALLDAHVGWTFDPARTRPPRWAQRVQDLYCDTSLFRIHYQYLLWAIAGLVVPAVIAGCVTATVSGAALALLWAGFVRVFLADLAIRSLNSLSHTFGSRSFATRDLSRNLWWLALPTLGQGWHHNHHAFPRSAFTSYHWWQLDPGGWVIRGLAALGLATSVRSMKTSAVQARLINRRMPSAEPSTQS